MKNIVINIVCIVSSLALIGLVIIYNHKYELTDEKVIQLINSILEINGFDEKINNDNNLKLECHSGYRYVYSFDYVVDKNFESNRYVIGFMYDTKNGNSYYNYFNPLGIIDDKCINTIDNGTGETD